MAVLPPFYLIFLKMFEFRNSKRAIHTYIQTDRNSKKFVTDMWQMPLSSGDFPRGQGRAGRMKHSGNGWCLLHILTQLSSLTLLLDLTPSIRNAHIKHHTFCNEMGTECTEFSGGGNQPRAMMPHWKVAHLWGPPVPNGGGSPIPPSPTLTPPPEALNWGPEPHLGRGLRAFHKCSLLEALLIYLPVSKSVSHPDVMEPFSCTRVLPGQRQ